VSHVQDLSEGHLSALDYAKAQGSHGGFSVFNLGKETHLVSALEGSRRMGSNVEHYPTHSMQPNGFHTYPGMPYHSAPPPTSPFP
jgi:hypothetical protein